MSQAFTRRDFLKGSLSAAGLTVVAAVTPLGVQLINASPARGETPAGFKPSAFFEVTPENLVRIMVPSSEMGQGVRTTLPMIVADELEADWEKVEILQAPAAADFQSPLLHSQLTVASASTRGWYMILRKAGAAGRTMLIEAAAKKWNVPAAECAASKNVVKHLKSGQSLTYGQLCQDAAALEVPQEPTLKDEADFIYMGKFMARVDIPDKINGRAVFGTDVNLPDLHYAVAARPPAYGAKPESFDQKAAEAVEGVVAVAPSPNGVLVCAKSFTAALKGRDALNVKWGPGSHPDMDTAMVKNTLMGDLNKPGANAITRGDPQATLDQAAQTYEAEFYLPCIAHTTMEPMNFTAHVQKDRCDLWGPTQGQTVAQMVASGVTKLPPENIFVNTTLLGCGLGRRATPDFIVDALIASMVAGKPVKLIWTREEDIQHDFFRSGMGHRIKAGLDQGGGLTAWKHQVSCFSLSKYMGMELKDGIDYYTLWGLFDPPQSPAKSQMAYPIPNFSVDLVLSDLPVHVCPWRSVQNAPNAFATESFMDELAHLAGKDPLTFRLDALGDNKRAKRVLRDAAMNSNWGKPLPKGWGRGIAQHTCFGTYVAQVAEVEVNRSGQVICHRVDVSVDCGPIVNPDALKAQLEGAVNLALSTVLYEEVQFAKGGVVSSNFDDYPILRMSESPEVYIHLVKSDDEIGGIGEPGIPPLAPAVANAVFNAVGARVRSLPLTPDKVLQAMKS